MSQLRKWKFGFCGDEDVKGVDPYAKRGNWKIVVWKGERTELKWCGVLSRDVPDLITVVFRMGLPDEQETIFVRCNPDTIPELS